MLISKFRYSNRTERERERESCFGHSKALLFSSLELILTSVRYAETSVRLELASVLIYIEVI